MRNFWRSWSGYYIVVYGLMVVCTACFFGEVREWNGAAWLLLLSSLPVYALGYTLPGMLLSAAAAAVPRRWSKAAAGGLAGFFSAAAMLLLLADLGLYHGFGFHFNLFVWNLLTTPGGFASMGLRNNTILPLTAALVFGFALHAAIVYFMIFFRQGAAGLFVYGILKGWRKYAWLAALVFCGLLGNTAYAWNHFRRNAVPLLAAERIPAYQSVTMQNIFEKLGFEAPRREELLLRTSRDANIRYPRVPIRRRPDRKRYNLVWLACESWRADMFTPEVMPHSWRFAERYGIRFTDNRSGGNGTRQGIFSMFYGLYGNYWHPFLAARRGALLIDWLQEDNYDIRCFSSANFSYPEFDHTVFAKVPSDRLHSFDRAKTYKRDIRNTKLLTDFIAADHGNRPFMAFMFFESPHHPYEFPKKNDRFKPHVDKVDYLKLDPGQAEKIKNRYRNSCFTLDGFLRQVFTVLEERKLLENTIVVLIGDHGEEFFEHGKLGHNSNFSDEQIHTPLVLHLPDRKPAVYDRMSSHVDVPAMLAPYFGVENPPADFSFGKNLLAPEAPVRKYAVIADWSTLFFAGEKYKMLLPLNNLEAITMTLYDARDRKLPDRQLIFRECRDELVEVQRDLGNFMR